MLWAFQPPCVIEYGCTITGIDRRANPDKLRCDNRKIAIMHKSGLVELEAVVAIARLGSFRASVLDLDMSPTAIGNAVASLGNRLGVRLSRSIISSGLSTPRDSCSRGRGCRATGGSASEVAM